MPQYLFLLYDDESRWSAPSEEEMAAEMGKHRAFAEAVAATDGAEILGGAALQQTATATTLRPSNSGPAAAGPIVSDGPFAETKEALGGYYLLSARDLDQALALARLCPMGQGCVEVRPVWEIPQQ
jgi:hypothetical protein